MISADARKEIQATKQAIIEYPTMFLMSRLGRPLPNGCGTAGCIAGFTVSRHEERAQGYRAEQIFRKKRKYEPRGEINMEFAGKILGLDDRMRKELFEPDITGIAEAFECDRKKPGFIFSGMAIACLDILIETGEVDWVAARERAESGDGPEEYNLDNY